ncbi:MAG: hypothetical protein V7735_06655 [Photobacterium frigidiphilum]
MTEKDLEEIKLDAKRYRFVKSTDHGELEFSQKCTLQAPERDKWDAIIDVQLQQMECDSHFNIGEKVLYASCHPKQPSWIKECFYLEAEVLKVWQPDSASEPMYQLRLLHNSRKTQSSESLLSHVTTPKKSTSQTWGQIEAKAIDGLMIRLLNVHDAEMLLNDALEIVKLEATEHKQFRTTSHVLLRSSSPYINIKIEYKNKATYMINGRRSNRENVFKALAKLECKPQNIQATEEITVEQRLKTG